MMQLTFGDSMHSFEKNTLLYMANSLALRTLHSFTGYVSLLGTSWIVLFSSALPLYIKNQTDFEYNVIVLQPFGWAVLGLSLLAFCFYSLSSRKGWRLVCAFITWLYYLAAIVFIAISILRGVEIALALKIVLMASATLIAVLAALRLAYKIPVTSAAPLFALLSTFFIATDIVQYQPQIKAYVPEAAIRNSVKVPLIPTAFEKDKLPNIYHILLDEFQTDMYFQANKKLVEQKLAGFHFFTDTTTLYGRTGMSLPSIFTGQSYNTDSAQLDYHKKAFNTESSFLHSLKSAGYSTSAYIHKVYGFSQSLFDAISFHKAKIKKTAKGFATEAALKRTFKNLWMYSNLPIPLSKKLMDEDYVEQQTAQNVLAPSHPIRSLGTFQLLTQEEGRKAAHGRYLFAHFLLPHFPYVLNEDCSYSNALQTSSPEQQTACTLQLLASFIDELKRLGRYDDSIIIIQSDHGARFDIVDGKLVNNQPSGMYSEAFSRSRAQSLLMIKPAKQTAALQQSSYPATLLDVAPTLLSLLALPIPANTEGVDLFNPSIPANERIRYYHFFNKLDKNEWTDSLVRYRIKDGEIKKVAKVKLQNNPQPNP